LSDSSMKVAEKVFEPFVFSLSLMKRTSLGIIVKDNIISVQEKVQLYNSWRNVFENLLYCYEIFEFFRHFELVDVQVAHMDKVLDPVGLVVMSFGLSQLIFMMRKDKIDSSRMNIHSLSKDSSSHS